MSLLMADGSSTRSWWIGGIPSSSGWWLGRFPQVGSGGMWVAEAIVRLGGGSGGWLGGGAGGWPVGLLRGLVGNVAHPPHPKVTLRNLRTTKAHGEGLGGVPTNAELAGVAKVTLRNLRARADARSWGMEHRRGRTGTGDTTSR